MIIKLSGKEIKDVRTDVLKDVSKQEVRKILQEEVNKYIGSKVERHLEIATKWNRINDAIRSKIHEGVERELKSIMKQKVIKVERVAKTEVLSNLNIIRIEKQIRDEVKSELLSRIGKI